MKTNIIKDKVKISLSLFIIPTRISKNLFVMTSTDTTAVCDYCSQVIPNCASDSHESRLFLQASFIPQGSSPDSVFGQFCCSREDKDARLEAVVQKLTAARDSHANDVNKYAVFDARIQKAKEFSNKYYRTSTSSCLEKHYDLVDNLTGASHSKTQDLPVPGDGYNYPSERNYDDSGAMEDESEWGDLEEDIDGPHNDVIVAADKALFKSIQRDAKKTDGYMSVSSAVFAHKKKLAAAAIIEKKKKLASAVLAEKNKK